MNPSLVWFGWNVDEDQIKADLSENLHIGFYSLVRRERALSMNRSKKGFQGLRGQENAHSGHPERCVCSRCEATR